MNTERKKPYPLPIVEMKIYGAFPGLVVSDTSIQKIMQNFMQALARLQAKGVHVAATNMFSSGKGAAKREPPLIIHCARSGIAIHNRLDVQTQNCPLGMSSRAVQ